MDKGTIVVHDEKDIAITALKERETARNISKNAIENAHLKETARDLCKLAIDNAKESTLREKARDMCKTACSRQNLESGRQGPVWLQFFL